MRRFIGFTMALSVAFTSLALPVSASAAYWVDNLPKKDAPISRGEFIRAAVDLNGMATDLKIQLPYKRTVPAGIRPFIGAAYRVGALEQFGSDLAPSKPITLGQALQVLMKVNNLTAKAGKASFTDVKKGTPLEQAVRVALEKAWIEPAREDMFGVDKVLTYAATRTLLRKVAGEDQVVPTNGDGTMVIRFTPRTRPPIPKQEILQAVWDLLDEQYLYNQKLDSDEAAYSAAEAMVKTLNDPYTTYLRPLPSQEFQSRMEGKVTGIGAQVEYRNDALMIVSPLPQSPAMKAGLLAGDEIIEANGESLAKMNFLQAVSKVRGPEGSSVKLKIRRGSDSFDVMVVRATINVPEIEVSWQGSTAIVHLVQFGERTDRELRSTMKAISDRQPTGIILDLRNNPGGLLHAAATVVSNFVPVGTTVAVIKTKTDEYTEDTEDPPTIDKTVKLVLLVNKGSASASEIVAGALQDTGRATVVGETTFGKGTVQQVVDFKDGSSLKMTIAEWFTPKKRKIDQHGIEPNVVVKSNTERDEQLLRALELARSSL